jgi:hypothetical protein
LIWKKQRVLALKFSAEHGARFTAQQNALALPIES